MKFTLSWLKDHIDTEASLAEICETLTRIGLEVENVIDPAAALKDFTIGYVVEAKQHPNADRLRVCMVDTGSGAPVQVVCGAPNARTGMKSVFSPPGTYIPGKKITLGKGVIRGVESLGMLCSAAELELSEDHDGIIELPDDAPVGQRYVEWAGMSDPVIEINLTPNRPDAAGVSGIARDLAAAGLGKLKTPAVTPAKGAYPCPVNVTLDFAGDDRKLCPQFALRMVRGVKNGQSPEWMQRRLKAIGLRPINALVDITNYVTFDRARPLHVFDAKKVAGNLVVRRGRSGDEVLALDGKSYTLDAANVVIADDNGVESIAGVMGGEHSGCDENTTDVLIESALWDPYNIANTGRRLGISTDARYRFERGVDPAFNVPGCDLATELVIQFCGGEPSEMVVAGHLPPARPALLFPWSEVQRLTGLELEISEMAGILEKLGFPVERTAGNADRAFVHIPSWRPDVEGIADLVEEIVRIAGLDRVQSTPLSRDSHGVAEPVLTLLQRRVSGARRALAARGMLEAVNWSFVDKRQAEAFGGGGDPLKLANPIASDLSDMRPSLAPGLLAAAQRNADRGVNDVALFEVGQVFRGDGEKEQFYNAAGIRRGTAKVGGAGRIWGSRATSVDVFDAKADALALLAALGVSANAIQIAPGGPSFLHPGRSASLQFGPKNIVGWFGEFHPATLEALDVEGPLCGFEITLDSVPAPKARPTKIKPKLELSDLMPLERDFAFVVDRATRAGDLLKAVLGADRALIADANVFDIYEGAGVPEGKKSVAVSVRLEPREKTLTDAEIEAVAAKIVAEATKKTGATLRG
ncbi:MAG: phenylalanine--tRNA ligase subunit beta [Methylobacteriaceae bacterium]|nr:phenylalanine--tRNA ligase subunit beta [Methylobacteriaceae bacterium]